MKPQGKITIFMVVMIVMLSIYYFTLPDKKNDTGDKTPPITEPVMKSEEFERLRTSLDESRNVLIADLNSIVASSTVGVNEKNEALEAINEIRQLALDENMLETEVMNLGYDDAFVQVSDDQITIKVLSDDFSVEKSNEIQIAAAMKFGMGLRIVVEPVAPVAD